MDPRHPGPQPGLLPGVSQSLSNPPLLPLLAEVFSVSSLSAGWTLAGCTAGLAASLLVCARLADRFGRRRIMLCSLAGAILLSCLSAWSVNLNNCCCYGSCRGPAGGAARHRHRLHGEEFSKRALLSAVGVYIAANSLGASPAGWSAVCWLAGLATGTHFSGHRPHQPGVAASRHLAAAGPDRFVPVIAKPGQFRQAIASHLGNPLLVGAYLIGGLNFMVFLNHSYLTFLLASPPSPCRPSGSACCF